MLNSRQEHVMWPLSYGAVARGPAPRRCQFGTCTRSASSIRIAVENGADVCENLSNHDVAHDLKRDSNYLRGIRASAVDCLR